MLRRTLNLGILAHVDAGKTTLTERLLYGAGVIDEIGSVDKGTTQTDSLALERQRGITIKSAVVSFEIDGVTVNLIDTPGHPDFIAEVERVLAVLDGVVLVISAVEGVQSQTRVLMRALKRLSIPTLMFVNKMDRTGADYRRVLREISDRLTPDVVAMEDVARGVDVLADHDDDLLAAYVADENDVSSRRLHAALAAQTREALVHPVFAGSAVTGAGIEALTAGVAELLPASEGDADGPVSALVFKIERGAGGEKIAYARLFTGTVRTRDRVRVGRDAEDKVTAISVFDHGGAVRRSSVAAGEIAKLWGLGDVQIGDSIGDAPRRAVAHEFSPPTLESVVMPVAADDAARLRDALGQLAEQDPLISVRQDEDQQLSVLLYGEVQKEVIGATLAADYGLEVDFRETTPIYVERPIAVGEAIELLHAESNPYLATVALRVEPAGAGSGVAFESQVDPLTVPLYLYKTHESFRAHMEEYVRAALHAGLFGWQVTDCAVTLTKCIYSVPDGPPSRRGPLSTAADFRKLTPLVLRQALERAGTVVCEPTVRARVELPADALGGVTAALARLGAALEASAMQGELAVVECVLPATRARDFQRQLSGLTRGEGVLESTFAGYEPVTGEPPVRRAAREAVGG